MRCGDCKFFEIDEGNPAFGHCSRWHEGYKDIDMKHNEVHVENDEGWGNIVGAEFGCVLFELMEQD